MASLVTWGRGGLGSPCWVTAAEDAGTRLGGRRQAWGLLESERPTGGDPRKQWQVGNFYDQQQVKAGVEVP